MVLARGPGGRGAGKVPCVTHVLGVGPSRYQVPGTLYGTRYFNPVETGVVPFERYQVLPGISTVP